MSSLTLGVRQPMGAFGRWQHSLRSCGLPVAKSGTLKIICSWHVRVCVCIQVCIDMCIYIYIHSPLEFISYHVDCRLASFFVSLSKSVWFSCKGGAPNYYPNSFSAPEQQPSALERKSQCSPDVQRFNSANEDNVTQVMASLSALGVA